MSENKTRPSDDSVEAYLESVPDPAHRQDARTVCELMNRVTGEQPALWGSMVGFGRYRYKYDSGREGEWFAAGFAPRGRETVVYLLADAADREQLLARLGKHRVGKSCLYIRRLADVDLAVLEQLVRSSLQALRERYPD